ncbi:hypothetical protein FJY71_05565 [candidate division WOR-3 bacterium]|nr:hypothetical protein [candidate division WOR-3 bacterium]
MRNSIRNAGIILCLLTLAAAGQGIDVSRLLQGVSVQRLPVNVGIRVDGGYAFQSRDLSYGLAGEVLFPVYGPLRCRATLLRVTLAGTSLDRVEFNAGAGLDLHYTFARSRSRVWPYAFIGGDLTLVGSNFDYGLVLGLGLEGRVRRYVTLFGEAGYNHTYRQAVGADAVLGRLGVRLGS